MKRWSRSHVQAQCAPRPPPRGMLLEYCHRGGCKPQQVFVAGSIASHIDQVRSTAKPATDPTSCHTKCDELPPWLSRLLLPLTHMMRAPIESTVWQHERKAAKQCPSYLVSSLVPMMTGLVPTDFWMSHEPSMIAGMSFNRRLRDGMSPRRNL